MCNNLLDFSSLLDYPVDTVADVFMKSNTTPPSSAAAEHLFGAAARVSLLRARTPDIYVQKWKWFFSFWAHISNGDTLNWRCSQQYDVRNVLTTSEKVSKAWSRYHFLHRRKELHRSPPWTRNTIERTIPSRSEGVTSAPVVFCVCTRPTFSHTVIMSVVVSKLGCKHLVFVTPGTKIDGDYYRHCWWSYCQPSKV